MRDQMIKKMTDNLMMSDFEVNCAANPLLWPFEHYCLTHKEIIKNIFYSLMP